MRNGRVGIAARSSRSAALALLVAWVASSCRTPEMDEPGQPTSAEATSAENTSSFVDLEGARHRPLDVEGAKAHVIVFATVDCPIANAYSPEVSSIVRDYTSKGVRFFIVHIDPDVAVERAQRHAQEFDLACPVLRDPGHELVRHCGATVTPEAAVLKPDGSMAYRGRIDDLFADLGRKRRAPRTRDLRDALDAVLEGRTVATPRTQAIGCYIPTLAELGLEPARSPAWAAGRDDSVSDDAR